MRDTDAIGVSGSNVMDTNTESDNDDEREGVSDCYISENNSSDADSSKGETYSDVENSRTAFIARTARRERLFA